MEVVVVESVVVDRAAAESSSRPCDSLWIQKLEDTKEKNKRPAPSSTCASLRVPFSPSLSLSLSLLPALFRFLCPALVRVCGCVCVSLTKAVEF